MDDELQNNLMSREYIFYISVPIFEMIDVFDHPELNYLQSF